MASFFVDENFYDHPKVLRAGEDAANLYLRGLAWARRHMSADIPKTAVSTLTSKRRSAALAAKLAEVGLWDDKGDCWHIHDWKQRNAAMISRSEAARKAAEARWSPMRDAPDPDASGMRDASVTQCQQEQITDTDNKAAASKSLTHDPPEGSAAAALIEGALKVLVERRMQAKADRGEAISNPNALRRAMMIGLRSDHAEKLADPHAASFETWSDLAAWLEPAPTRKPSPLESTVAAQNALAKRNDARRIAVPIDPNAGARLRAVAQQELGERLGKK